MADEEKQSSGDAWNDDITGERKAELEAVLQAWAHDADHGEKRGPFDGIKLTGADVFWLAARSTTASGDETAITPAKALLNDKTGSRPAVFELNLEGADLRDSHLEGAYLNQAHLEEADLRDSHLEGAILYQAHLEGAYLYQAHLEGADLWDAHLERTYLKRAHLERTSLLGAHLEGADLQWAHLEGAIFYQAHLERAGLYQAYLEKANLQWAHLEGAGLNQAHLERANLGDAYLEGAVLWGAHLEGAYLNQAHLENANLWWTRLEGADLQGAHLEGADLRVARLAGANLNQAHLEGAYLYQAYLEGADLREAYLEGADLRGAHLEGADLRGVHLEGRRIAEDAPDLKHIRQWASDFPSVLPPADLRLAYFDRASQLTGTRLGNADLGYVRVADTRWGEVNLAVVDWSDSPVLHDERAAREWKPPKQDAQSKRPTRQERRAAHRKQHEERLNLFRRAIRANRQLAAVLRDQGLNDDADKFAYRAQLTQRTGYRLQGRRGQWLFSWLLFLLAGYGYRLERILISYGLIVGLFAAGFLISDVASGQGAWTVPHALDALQISLNAIHGRVFFAQFPLDTMQSWLATAESIVGIVIEGIFVAILIQRFFGK